MSDKELEKKAKEERNAYFREYRRKNRERIAEHQKRYWLKKAAEKLNSGSGTGSITG